MSAHTDDTAYAKLTPSMALGLAAPHTWAASIMPVLVACAAAYAAQGTLSVSMAIVLLVICVALQSAVNTLNDYFDFKKGTDGLEDNLERSDAVLLYNHINPKDALYFAVALVVAAFVLGIYPIVIAGFMPLVIALIGAAIVFLYSGGRTPISYLPIGEAVSGFTMGGLMCFACSIALTKTIDLLVFVWALPLMIGIALIMQSNNTCDIEKDRAAGRKTLPALIGRDRSRTLYRALFILWLICIVLDVIIWFTRGAVVLPFMLLAVIPIAKGIFANPLVPESRIAAMNLICMANIALGAFYAAALFASHLIPMV